MDETKQYYRTHGICVDCGRYDAVPGRTCCEVCAAKRAERERRRYRDMDIKKKAAYLKQHSESGKQRYYRRKNNGLCVNCGKPQARDSTRLCISCRAKEKQLKEKRKGIPRYEMPSYGLCYLCCKNPILDGKKLCAECYEKQLKSMEKARNSANSKEGRKYFRNLEYLDFLERTQKGRGK